ncbi:NADPH:quinone reductase-like Zn-dependent oxidoreductase [Streptomyces demainii]|uniref:NADPH:quinone reductase-like Zn-dependent oxidoreductase n=1 Tax=Streptomyces demainii TaxID=588122 RepID=A0ABT9L5Z5_9ACTN|nr:NADPH:quinone reductase-like Zn-dependent oxidoreductase [Streptomyces demainii]
MRVITQQTLGGPEVLTIVDAPEPQPLPTEVLVRVKAIGLNPLEALLRAGAFPPLIGRPPFILGWDISGVVEEAPRTWRFRPGDEVFGMPLFPRPASAYAEVVSAPALHLARKPASLSHVEASALPIVGLTAWQGLVDLGGVTEGDRVLVHGGGRRTRRTGQAPGPCAGDVPVRARRRRAPAARRRSSPGQARPHRLIQTSDPTV